MLLCFVCVCVIAGQYFCDWTNIILQDLEELIGTALVAWVNILYSDSRGYETGTYIHLKML